MKSVICALLIFIFIIVTGISSIIYVNRCIDEMLQIVYRNENYFANSMWEEAENEIIKIEKLWGKKRPVLSAFLDHEITGQVDTAVAKLKNAVKMRKKDDFFYECDNFKLILLNIKEQHKISMENIF